MGFSSNTLESLMVVDDFSSFKLKNMTLKRFKK